MKKNKKGFTLVELVIVVAVMAVLVAVAIPTVSAITKTAQENVAATNAQTIESMIKLAQAEKSGEEGGIHTMTATEIDTALTKAALGIDSGSFVYNPTTGVCKVGTSPATGEFLITFSTNADSITVS